MLQTSHLALSTITTLFVDQYGHSLWFGHFEFDKEVISDGCRNGSAWYQWGFWIFSDFRDLCVILVDLDEFKFNSLLSLK